MGNCMVQTIQISNCNKPHKLSIGIKHPTCSTGTNQPNFEGHSIQSVNTTNQIVTPPRTAAVPVTALEKDLKMFIINIITLILLTQLWHKRLNLIDSCHIQPHRQLPYSTSQTAAIFNLTDSCHIHVSVIKDFKLTFIIGITDSKCKDVRIYSQI